MTRPAADDLMAAYDLARSAYHLACRLGVGQEEAFAAWNEARERIIGELCQEAEEPGRAA